MKNYPFFSHDENTWSVSDETHIYKQDSCRHLRHLKHIEIRKIGSSPLLCMYCSNFNIPITNSCLLYNLQKLNHHSENWSVLLRSAFKCYTTMWWILHCPCSLTPSFGLDSPCTYLIVKLEKGSLEIDWQAACPMRAWQGVKWTNCSVTLMLPFCKQKKKKNWLSDPVIRQATVCKHQIHKLWSCYHLHSAQLVKNKTPTLCWLHLFMKGWATCIWLSCVSSVATVLLFRLSKAVIRVTASTQSIVSLCVTPAEWQRNILIKTPQLGCVS